jgi:nucleoside diphosphate kinase
MQAIQVRAGDLTAVPGKAELYEGDPWFRRGLVVASEVLDRSEIWRLGSLLAKPEAIFGRRLEQILRYLDAHSFEVVATSRVDLKPEKALKMWEYNWRAATPERRDLVSELLSAGPSMLCLVADRRPPARYPAATRLTALKGPTLPDRRSPIHLRSVLGSRSRLLNFVHTADDPADIVRELALLLEDEQHWRLLEETRAREHGPERALATMRQLYEVHAERSLDPNGSFAIAQRRLLRASRSNSTGSRSAEEAMALLELDRQKSPGSLPWLDLKPRILASLPTRDLWHAGVYATTRIPLDRIGSEPDLPDGSISDWPHAKPRSRP